MSRPIRALAGDESRTGSGVALAAGSSASMQFGASVGALTFPVLGPVGVVSIRQLFVAAIYLLLARPRLRAFTRSQWLLVAALALVFSVMGICVYAAFERIGTGLTVTLEFLGPLGVAIATSRRLIDIGCAVLAAVGVVVIVQPGPSTDVAGIAFALAAALTWAAYILLSRRLGAELSGVQGTAAANLISAVLLLPFAVFWLVAHTPPLWALGFLLVGAVLSSVVPYTLDLMALRRLTPGLFSTLTSLHPVWAVLLGWVVLHQALSPVELLGVALVVASNVIVAGAAVRRSRAKRGL
ncbi:MAG: EamA family transporter [Candidatus Leucobacter sulfamidivorax]|jgi:inner membrane transporter RhtA|nr:EamA family transporter [Candidatus Leucobacter sulfamidivorax]